MLGDERSYYLLLDGNISTKHLYYHLVMNNLILFHSLIYRFGRYQLRYLPNVHTTREWKDRTSNCIDNSIGLGVKAPLKHRIINTTLRYWVARNKTRLFICSFEEHPLVGLSTNCWEIHYRKIITLSRIFETIDMWDHGRLEGW